MSTDALQSAATGMRASLAALNTAAAQIAAPEQVTLIPERWTPVHAPVAQVVGVSETPAPAYIEAPLAFQMIQVMMAQRGFEANAAVVGRATETYRQVARLGRSAAAHS